MTSCSSLPFSDFHCFFYSCERVLNSNNIHKSSHFLISLITKMEMLKSCMKLILMILAGNEISIIFNIYLKNINLFKYNYLIHTITYFTSIYNELKWLLQLSTIQLSIYAHLLTLKRIQYNVKFRINTKTSIKLIQHICNLFLLICL